MRIALRTSGGRGEYELAGSQGDVLASNLFEHEMSYELTPELTIPGRCRALQIQGKPRIRLHDQGETTHLYRLLAGVLLLPRPRRELRIATGPELLHNDAYAITSIKVDVGRTTDSSVVLRPTDLLLENSERTQLRIDFQSRMSKVVLAWEAARERDDELCSLIRLHRDAVMAANPSHVQIEQESTRIARFLRCEIDPLPEIELQLGLSQQTSEPDAFRDLTAEPLQADFGEVDDKAPTTATLLNVRKWRQTAVRGVEGQRFREEVIEAYDYRCLFSGNRLPPTAVTVSQGVDAAHILPWSSHRINAVQNGLCLDKLCHWAFDQGILRLAHQGAPGQYVLEVPRPFSRAARGVGFSVECFERLAGPIPRERLPRDPMRWPRPEYLAALNAYMAPKFGP